MYSGEIARRAGTSPNALRHDETLDLLGDVRRSGACSPGNGLPRSHLACDFDNFVIKPSHSKVKMTTLPVCQSPRLRDNNGPIVM